MAVFETTPSAVALLLLRNLVVPALIYADKSLVTLGQKYKILEFVRYLIITGFLFFLRILPSLLVFFNHNLLLKPPKMDTYTALTPPSGSEEPGISRALLQILSLINDIPVSSRKYEVLRSLAEKLIEENQSGNFEALRLVNRTTLSAAFVSTLSQLEAAMMDLGYESVENGQVQKQLNRVLRAVRCVKDGTLLGALGGRKRDGMEQWEEKLAAELLWLSQKLAACGCGDEAVCRWASASNLACLALSAEPRLQSSLLKISAFILKQAREWEVEEIEEDRKQKQKQVNKKILMAWLPLLCKACKGTDMPVLSSMERSELEKVLEHLISTLDKEDDREDVLSLWLQNFTYSPSSDWPNLIPSFDRWCSIARKRLILHERLKYQPKLIL